MPTEWELQKAAWAEYTTTEQYRTRRDLLESYGLTQPYIDNIIRQPFEYAWRCKKVKVIVKGELTQGEKRRKKPKQ